MNLNDLSAGGLVVYKNRPARISSLDNKRVLIELAGGDSARVRPKDVTLLHPGPVENLSKLAAPPGDVETGWELLAGEKTTTGYQSAQVLPGLTCPSTTAIILVW